MDAWPVALRFVNSIHFLDFLIHDRHEIKHVVLCSTRESFVQELLSLVNTFESEDNQEPEPELLIALLQKLLTPNLNNLALGRNTSIVFTPTLSHLRAYLASRQLDARSTVRVSGGGSSRPPANPPLLAVYGSLDLHLGTSELSAQGLSRTMSLATEATRSAGARLLMAECDHIIEREIHEDAPSPRSDQSMSPFALQVPILSRTPGYARNDRVWVGKTLPVRTVWARWCHIPSTSDKSLSL